MFSLELEDLSNFLPFSDDLLQLNSYLVSPRSRNHLTMLSLVHLDTGESLLYDVNSSGIGGSTSSRGGSTSGIGGSTSGIV